MNNGDIYGGRDPRNIPNYTAAEVGRYLGVSGRTVSAWVNGTTYNRKVGKGSFEPVIRLEDSAGRLLSFTNMVELYVVAALRQRYNVALRNIRTAVAYVEEHLGVEHPLAHKTFETDGVDLFVKAWDELINASRGGQVEMKEIVREYLQRVEWDENAMASKLYPLMRKDADPSLVPKVICIDPRIAFGAPIIAGTGISFGVLRSRAAAGDTIEDLSCDYGIDQQTLKTAFALAG